MSKNFKFSITETVTFGEVQFTVSVTTVPSVKEGSAECAAMRAKADRIYQTLRKHLSEE